MIESTVTAEQTRPYVRQKKARPKIGEGLPSLRPTLSSIVDDDDPTARRMDSADDEDSDACTVMYLVQGFEPRDPMPTLTEPAIERARRKTAAAAVTHKRRKYRLENALTWAPALVCDVCVVVLFALLGSAGSPALVRWLPKQRPASTAELAPPPVERMEVVATTTLPAHVVESIAAPPVTAAPVETPAKAKVIRPTPTRKAAARNVDRRR